MKIIFLLIFLFISQKSISASFDLDFSSGILLGSVNDRSNGSTEKNRDFGGVPLYLGISKDVSKYFMLNLQFQIILDLYNIRISRSGLELGLNYYLLGGAKNYIFSSNFVDIVIKNPFGLALSLYSGYQSYFAVSPISSETLEGNVLDTKAGFLFRYDIEKISIKVGAYHTIYSLPMGQKTLTSSLFEFITSVGLSI